MHGVVARSFLGPLAERTQARLSQFDTIDLGRRLAAADPTIWSNNSMVTGRIAQRLGWIRSPLDAPIRGVPAAAGRVMLLGMGGSSLGAAACARAFGAAERLRVVDSTIPAAVRAVDTWLEEVTDVVVASKSGGTIETAVLADYFEARCDGRVRFHAVTDPGSELEDRAAAHGYAACHLNAPDIGGRFSVLSHFGSVPLGLAGVEVGGIGMRAAAMAGRCATPAAVENPGLWLGAVLAAAAATGRDKILLQAAPGLEGLADWIEQLVAESTGKDGAGLVPVTHAEPDGGVELPADRTVVLLEWTSPADDEGRVEDWVRAGVPVVRLALREPHDIGAEFYRWQVAVAAVGVALGINPFDEPDVASAKRRTGEMLRATEDEGRLPRPVPDWSGDRVQLFASGMVGRGGTEILTNIVEPTASGYLGLLAFLPSDPTVEAALDRLREVVGGPNPVTLGWGPRYLHSSGQLHKGGQPTGRFLMLTADDAEDVEIPGRPWTLGTLARAQALGDAFALEEVGRTVVRAHLSGSLEPAIAELVSLLKQAR